ncbi:hypothetical protein SSP24_57310 [Streptomyces spinoverrucosus]|uniref:Uncharacterized protein n=1 Tax=Streptomyces spinoverrucosus TaxID=284043 RepID=A0A4Y3VSZ4_9ACTN|nr:hypothetical protein SSP24_57310 [Streptomyces spinoverrucosus]GHB64921.1 hypothetical protein GCM10010397_38620 [Streptomyces spinoverrucosus]
MLQHIGREGDVGHPVGQRQQIPVGDHGAIGRLLAQLTHVGLKQVGLRTTPPKPLGEVPTTPTDIDNDPPGDGTVVGLDLGDGVAGEEGVAGVRGVLFVAERPEEGKGTPKRRILETPARRRR